MLFPVLDGLKLHKVLVRTIKEFVDDEMPTYASALAYQMLFSLFPFLLFLIALIGFLHLPDFFSWLRLQSELVLPPQALEQVNPVIDQLQQSKGGLLSVGIVIALWTASAGVRLMMSAMNAAYDVVEGRPIWKRFPLSIFYTVGIAGMLLAAAALMVLGPQVMEWLAADCDLADVRRGPHVLRDAGRRAGISLYHPRLRLGRGGMDRRLPGLWLLRQDLRGLQRHVWQYRCDHCLAPVFLHLCRRTAAGRGDERGDRAYVCRGQGPR